MDSLLGEWLVFNDKSADRESKYYVEIHKKDETLRGSVWRNDQKSLNGMNDISSSVVSHFVYSQLTNGEQKLKFLNSNLEIVLNVEEKESGLVISGKYGEFPFDLELFGEKIITFHIFDSLFDVIRSDPSPEAAELPKYMKSIEKARNNKASSLDFMSKYSKYLPYVYVAGGVVLFQLALYLIFKIIKNMFFKEPEPKQKTE